MQPFNIFVFVGTIASIISMIIGLWKYKKTYQIINVILVVGLSVFASQSYFKYTQLIDNDILLAKNKESARKDAVALLNGFPKDISYANPGEGRGVALAGLAFFEQHKALYPDTYKHIKIVLEKDIEYSQSRSDSSDERHSMKTAGTTILYALRGLASTEHTGGGE